MESMSFLYNHTDYTGILSDMRRANRGDSPQDSEVSVQLSREVMVPSRRCKTVQNCTCVLLPEGEKRCEVVNLLKVKLMQE